jgi:hypothetical protein
LRVEANPANGFGGYLKIHARWSLMRRKNFIFFSLMFLSSLVMVAVLLAHSSKDQNGKERPNLSSIMDALEKTKQLLVFRADRKEKREYLGCMTKESYSFAKVLSTIRAANSTEDHIPFCPQFEIIFLGDGVLWSVQYDPETQMIVAYCPVNNRLEKWGAFRLSESIESTLLKIAVTSRVPDKFKPSRTAKVEWSPLPYNLDELIKRSSLVLIGTPVSILRNNYREPNDPLWQVTVYAVVVERYLKDQTGLFLPVIKHYQNGGRLGGGRAREGDPLLEIGQRYLLFLEPPRCEYAVLETGVFRSCYGDEYITVHPLTRTPIVNGGTEPAESDPSLIPIYWFSDNKTRLIFKKEQQVIGEVLTAIKRSQVK